MKYFLLLFLIIPIYKSYSQNQFSQKIGQTTIAELKKNSFKLDPSAKALILYEHLNVYNDKDDLNSINSDHYSRIKIIDKSSSNITTVSIKTYGEEKVVKIKAITYNLDENENITQNILSYKDIFKQNLNSKWIETKFTFPNIKNGSVVEYVYTIKSPYSAIDDWYFQSYNPKLHSEINVSIINKQVFRSKLTGNLKLAIDTMFIDRKCTEKNFSCGNLKYAMTDIPAFKDIQFISSPKNLMAKVNIDISPTTQFKLDVEQSKVQKDIWNKLDENFKKYYLKKEINKSGFFKRKLLSELSFSYDTLANAKTIYNYIKDYYSWNAKNWPSEDLDLKKTFKTRTGSATEINLSLYNSLLASKIICYPVILSTRKNGFTSEIYPSLKGFNYVLVKVIINGKDYFLDATNKYRPFGELPLKVINGKVRVLDFENESFWKKTPYLRGYKNIRIKGSIIGDNFVGDMAISRTGYKATKTREIFTDLKKKNYISQLESINSNLIIDKYENYNLINLEKIFREKISIQVELEQQDDRVLKINPFFIDKLSINLFQEKTREYPINFGKTKELTYALKLKIPSEYKLGYLPKNSGKQLPNNGGSFILKYEHKKDYINVLFKFKLSKGFYLKEDYQYLKAFYSQIIENQKSTIEFIKK